MSATEADKKYSVSQPKLTQQVLFDTSKKQMLNPNQGYKKLVQKLKTRYKVRNCDSNKIVRNQQNRVDAQKIEGKPLVASWWSANALHSARTGGHPQLRRIRWKRFHFDAGRR